MSLKKRSDLHERDCARRDLQVHQYKNEADKGLTALQEAERKVQNYRIEVCWKQTVSGLVTQSFSPTHPDILWAHHAIFLVHPHRHSLGSSRNLPPSRTSAEAKGTFLPFVCSRLPITAADFAPKIGGRSRENYLTTNRRRPRLCPYNRGKVTVSVELLWVQSP